MTDFESKMQGILSKKPINQTMKIPKPFFYDCGLERIAFFYHNPLWYGLIGLHAVIELTRTVVGWTWKMNLTKLDTATRSPEQEPNGKGKKHRSFS
jgi:hypothetical protein